MANVKLYRWHRANYAENAVGLYKYGYKLLSVEELHGTHEEYDDDGGKWYVLPDGYELGTSKTGEDMIFDGSGRGCEIVATSDSDDCKPQVVSAAGIETLQAVDEQ